MKYRIISAGKIREPFFRDGVNEYRKRLKPYVDLELIEGLEEKISPGAGNNDIKKVLYKEAQKILNIIKPSELLVILDINGRQLDSVALAEQINQWNTSGNNHINWVVGSSHGLAPELKHKAHCLISFSSLTFPHQMSVLILIEQIYRSFKIIKGEPYHK